MARLQTHVDGVQALVAALLLAATLALGFSLPISGVMPAVANAASTPRTDCRGPVAALTDRFFSNVMSKNVSAEALLAEDFTAQLTNDHCRTLNKSAYLASLSAELTSEGTVMLTPLLQLEAGQWGVAFAMTSTSSCPSNRSGERTYFDSRSAFLLQTTEGSTPQLARLVQVDVVDATHNNAHKRTTTPEAST